MSRRNDSQAKVLLSSIREQISAVESFSDVVWQSSGKTNFQGSSEGQRFTVAALSDENLLWLQWEQKKFAVGVFTNKNISMERFKKE
jgi:hypothetical protein